MSGPARDGTTGLPYDLAPPLHLLEPWWQRPVTWVVLGLLLLLALWWWRRRLRRPSQPVAEEAELPPPPAPAAESGAAAAVRRIWERYREGGDLRLGLSELSLLLRGHFARELPLAQRRPGLTARGLARRLGAAPASRLLRRLADHQFGRRDPTRDDFDAVCELALKAVGGGGSGRHRRRRGRSR